MKRLLVLAGGWVQSAGPTARILQGILAAFYAVAAQKFYQIVLESTANVAFAVLAFLLFFIVPAWAAVDGEWLKKRWIAKLILWILKVIVASVYAFQIHSINRAAAVLTACLLFVCDVLATFLADLAKRRHRRPGNAASSESLLVPPDAAASRDNKQFSNQKLSRLASPIALYPDALLAYALTAATHWDQIPKAARWAEAHRHLQGGELASAVIQNGLSCHSSIQALLPFMTVLGMMRFDMHWTIELGKAMQFQTEDLLDTIQILRLRAWDWGSLKPCRQANPVRRASGIEIHAKNFNLIHIPVYDFVALHDCRRPTGRARAFIEFKRGIRLGQAVEHGGLSSTWINWRTHEIFAPGEIWNPVRSKTRD